MIRLKALIARAKNVLGGESEAESTELRSSAEIEELIVSLKSQNPDERRGANVCLCDPGVSDVFVAPLLNAARDSDPYIRTAAIHAFAHYDTVEHPQALEAILQALAADSDHTVRTAAAEVLESQPPECVPALVKALADESVEVREKVVWALGAHRTEEALAALKDRLHHDVAAAVRARATSELGGIKDELLIPDLLKAANDADPSVRAEALLALRECDRFEKRPELHEVFISALSDHDAGVRKAAANALKFSSTLAIPALSIAVSDEAPEVREEAISALGSVRAQEAIDIIAERLFNDVNEDVRERAVHALGDMQHPRAAEHLVKAFNNDAAAQKLRWFILWALGDNKDFGALPVLCTALSDPDAEFRERAADSLGSLPWEDHPDKEAALESLSAALNDVEARVRESVCDALGSLEDSRAVPSLVRALRDSEDGVRSKAVEAIANINAEGNAALIAGCLRDPSIEVQRSAAKSLWLPEGTPIPPDALSFLTNPDVDADVRSSLGKSLARHGDPAVIPHLLEALATDDMEARIGIIEALQNLPDPRATAPLLSLLDDGEDCVRAEAALALAAIGDDKAVKPLKSMLKRDRSPYVRRRVVWALSFFSPEMVLPLLTGAFGDKDPHVRLQAVKALSEICDVSQLQYFLSELPKRLEDVREALVEAIQEREEEEESGESAWPRHVAMGTLHYE